MGRARNIKPGFFKNEDLGECSPWARLCFAGLWTLADREGRLEDRPKRIKGELFPFDSIEVDPLLQELERFKFIVRYESDGMKAIQILEFAKHQTPHYSEKDSVIKPPELLESGGHEEHEIPEISGELQNQVVIKGGSQPPESLNPDSLIPDCRIPASSNPDSEPPKASPRATRKCPPGFKLTEELKQWAKSRVPGVNIETETETFRDHTFATARSDWDGTWRNWMRKAANQSRPNHQQASADIFGGAL